MGLVSSDYNSDSDSDSDSTNSVSETGEDSIKRQCLPELPDDIVYNYNKPVVIDPLNTRMYIAPVSKNIGFLFLELRLDSKQQQIMDLVLKGVNAVMDTHHRNSFEPLHRGKFGAMKPLHVSLSETMMFANESELEEKMGRIRQEIRALECKSVPVALSGGWLVYENFDASLQFLAVGLSEPARGRLKPVLSIVEKYKPRSPVSRQPVDLNNLHVSFGVAQNAYLQQDESISRQRLDSLRNLVSTEASDRLPLLRANLQFRCHELKAKVGTSVITLPL